MKLASAIEEKSDLGKKITDLSNRIIASGRVQEGDEPLEECSTLLIELDEVYTRLEELTRSITKTNQLAKFNDEYSCLADALSARNIYAKKISVLTTILNGCAPQSRFSRTEIKFVNKLDTVTLRKEIEKLTKQKRELNTAIQEFNWIVDV